MILLIAKPLFSQFQLIMMAFIGLGLIGLVVVNVKNRIAESRRIRHCDDLRAKMKIVEPLNSAVSSKDNVSYKN